MSSATGHLPSLTKLLFMLRLDTFFILRGIPFILLISRLRLRKPKFENEIFASSIVQFKNKSNAQKLELVFQILAVLLLSVSYLLGKISQQFLA